MTTASLKKNLHKTSHKKNINSLIKASESAHRSFDFDASPKGLKTQDYLNEYPISTYKLPAVSRVQNDGINIKDRSQSTNIDNQSAMTYSHNNSFTSTNNFYD